MKEKTEYGKFGYNVITSVNYETSKDPEEATSIWPGPNNDLYYTNVRSFMDTTEH